MYPRFLMCLMSRQYNSNVAAAKELAKMTIYVNITPLWQATHQTHQNALLYVF
ncbi:MAG: hypothetical protein ACJA0C_000128 [Candidatus Endobugula sp.]|jgi:hypothetical protein